MSCLVMKKYIVAVCSVVFFSSLVIASVSKNRTASVEILDDKNWSTKTIQLKQVRQNVWRAQIPIAEIPNNAKLVNVVYQNAVAKKGEDGYFVLGDNRLGHFTKDNGTLISWKFFMPIYGMKTPRGTFVAIIKGLKDECGIEVSVKKGEYKIYTKFEIGKHGYAPYEDIVIDFYDLHGKNANYSAMARLYRDYQLRRGEVQPIKERVKKSPTLAYSTESVFVRVKHGSKDLKNRVAHQTPETEPKLFTFYSFDWFINMMRQLKEMGVEKAEMCMVGWQAGGFDGRYPQYFPIPKEFGGEAKLREAIKTAHSLDYQIVCHTNATEWVEIGEGFDINDIIRLPNGNLPKQGKAWVGGVTFLPCLKRVYERFTENDFKKISELGFRGNHHIDVLGCMKSRSCCNTRHALNKKESVKYMRKIATCAEKYFGGYGSECGIDHSAKYQDYALYISAFPKYMGGRHPLVDTLVPLWQIAYHGIILSNPYLETLDYSYRNKSTMVNSDFLGSYEKRRLKLVEYGGRPSFYFAPYKETLEPIKEAYDGFKKRAHLQYEFMNSHEEVLPDVFLVTYSNGEKILCNYTSSEVSVLGQTVKPLDYVLFK